MIRHVTRVSLFIASVKVTVSVCGSSRVLTIREAIRWQSHQKIRAEDRPTTPGIKEMTTVPAAYLLDLLPGARQGRRTIDHLDPCLRRSRRREG